MNERRVLRAITAVGVEAIHACAGDPEVPRFRAWVPNTADDARTLVHVWLEVLATEPVEVVGKLVVDGSGQVIEGRRISGAGC